jgi:raffinose/stachyose/melibiose transport system substrate-binding protein
MDHSEQANNYGPTASDEIFSLRSRIVIKNLRLIIIICIVILVTGNVLALAQGDPVTVTLWVGSTLQADLDYLNVNFVAPFEELHPEINLEITGQEAMQDLLRTAILGGTAPDLLQTFGPSWNAEYIDGGYMLPLEPYAELYGWKDKLLPWAYATGTIQDVLYAIPGSFESIVMFYNKTLFEANGWSVPTNRVEFETVAAAAQDLGIHPLAYGNQGQVFANGHLISAYLNNFVEHDDLRAALVGEKQWTDPVFVDAINLLTSDMTDNSWWSGGVENYYQYGGEDYWTELATGEAAMMIVGTWGFDDAPTYFEATENEWDWAPIPNMNASPRPSVYPLAIGDTLGINASSEHKDEAALVLDYLISNPDAVLRIAAGFNFTAWMIPLKFTLDDFPDGTDPRVVRFQSEFASATAEGNFGYANWTFWPGPANTQLRTDIEGVWEGLTTTEDYLAAQQAVWNEVRAEGKTIPIP